MNSPYLFSWTAGTGYTKRHEQIDNSSHERFASEDKVIVTATTTSATFTVPTSSSWAAALVTFKPLVVSPASTAVTYNYDKNGNLASTTAGLFNTWDYNNRLTQSISSTTTTYAYDADGDRVLYDNGSSTTFYPNKYYDVTGTTSIRQIWAGNMLVATMRNLNGSLQMFYIHDDHLGSPTITTNTTGGVVETQDYYPYGDIKFDTPTGSFKEPRKYIGQEYILIISDSRRNGAVRRGTFFAHRRFLDRAR